MDIHVMTDSQQSQLERLLADARKIVILTHKSPDGDAMGSSLAWAQYLISLEKEVMIAVPDAFPDFLRWLSGTEKVVRYDKHPEKVEEAMKQADMVCCLDFNTTSRVAAMQELLETSAAQKILIDHHVGPEIDTVLCLSFPEMSSTCELLFRIIHQLGGFETMSKSMAVALYCGMMTDTGGFTYNSSAPEIFYIISMLLTKKFDKDKIYRNVYNNYSDWCIRLRGYLMCQKMNYIPTYHAAYYTLTKKEMRRFRFVKGDVEGLVNEPLRIKGVKLSVSLREDTERENKIWVSLRSVDQYYCNVLAEKYFNGGGHPNAAGGHLDCSMDEAELITREALKYFKDYYGL